jgi:hypothetical protein
MSESFTADWLALREPCDVAAVDPGLLSDLATWAAGSRELSIVDLGAGTGAACRRLSPRLPCPQRWTLIERDPALLAAGQVRLGPAATYQHLDLAHDLEAVADLRPDLITMSALLDLVAAAWVDRVVSLVLDLDAALYVALTYDGHVAWNPVDARDADVTAAVNRHQRLDKGFGPALGPAATGYLAQRLRAAGGEPGLANSAWHLGPDEALVQRLLLDGHAAAVAMNAGDNDWITSWQARRHALIDAGTSAVTVGHNDLLFLPQRPRR